MDISNNHLRQLESNSRLAVATSIERIRKMRLSPERLNVHCFKNQKSIHEYSLKILATKEFRFMNELNEFIGRASSCGLISKWLSGNQLKISSKFNALTEYNEMNVEKSGGIFLVIGCLMILALFVVTLERIVYKKVRTPNAAKMWQYVEKAIDPNRYFLLETLDL